MKIAVVPMGRLKIEYRIPTGTIQPSLRDYGRFDVGTQP
jgi:hypothetical protein